MPRKLRLEYAQARSITHLRVKLRRDKCGQSWESAGEHLSGRRGSEIIYDGAAAGRARLKMVQMETPNVVTYKVSRDATAVNLRRKSLKIEKRPGREIIFA